jgi:hypothetical protein
MQNYTRFREAQQPALASALEDVSLTALDHLNKIGALAYSLTLAPADGQPERAHEAATRTLIALIAQLCDEAENDISVCLERQGLPASTEQILQAQQGHSAPATPATVQH